jgi:hypothetical protein
MNLVSQSTITDWLVQRSTMSGRGQKNGKDVPTTKPSTAVAELTHAKQVELPAVTITRSSKHLELRCDRGAAILAPCTTTVLRTFAKNVHADAEDRR